MQIKSFFKSYCSNDFGVICNSYDNLSINDLCDCFILLYFYLISRQKEVSIRKPFKSSYYLNWLMDNKDLFEKYSILYKDETIKSCIDIYKDTPNKRIKNFNDDFKLCFLRDFFSKFSYRSYGLMDYFLAWVFSFFSLCSLIGVFLFSFVFKYGTGFVFFMMFFIMFTLYALVFFKKYFVGESFAKLSEPISEKDIIKPSQFDTLDISLNTRKCINILFELQRRIQDFKENQTLNNKKESMDKDDFYKLVPNEIQNDLNTIFAKYEKFRNDFYIFFQSRDVPKIELIKTPDYEGEKGLAINMKKNAFCYYCKNELNMTAEECITYFGNFYIDYNNNWVSLKTTEQVIRVSFSNLTSTEEPKSYIKVRKLLNI